MCSPYRDTLRVPSPLLGLLPSGDARLCSLTVSEQPPMLVGPRVYLRPLTPRDFEDWRAVRMRNRSWVEPWEPRPEPGSADPVVDREAFRARCGAWDRQRHFDTAHGFGMFLRDGSFVGEISIGSVQRGPFQSAYVGYWIGEEHAGQGYIPEGVALVLQYSFVTLGLHRIEIAIVPRNRASRRVVEKLELREEGVAQGFLQIDGVYEDHVRYGITAEEWDVRGDDIVAKFLT